MDRERLRERCAETLRDEEHARYTLSVTAGLTESLERASRAAPEREIRGDVRGQWRGRSAARGDASNGDLEAHSGFERKNERIEKKRGGIVVQRRTSRQSQ